MGSFVQAAPRLSNSRLVAIGASAVASTAVGNGCYAVMISSTGACHFAVGSIATANSAYLPANVAPLIVGARPGETVSVIQDAASTGNVSISDVTY